MKYCSPVQQIDTHIFYVSIARVLHRSIVVKSNIDSANNIHLYDKNKQKRLLVLVIFTVIFFYCWLLLSSSSPFFWAKTSLTLTVTPQSTIRGVTVQISGSLTGEDISGKTIGVEVSCPSSTIAATLSATTDATGYWHTTWLIPLDSDIGKHTVSVSFDTLTDTDNFQVKLAAPQKNRE